MSTVALARTATAAALRMRTRHGRAPFGPLCPYDLAADEGVQVRFEPIPSLEGIYRAGPAPLILLSALRQPGRKAYNCAHELGHHALGHGTRVDELLEVTGEGFEPDEYAADCFASALLMPKTAVHAAFARRRLTPALAAPTEMFAVAGYFGVGYTTLVGHLERTLGALPEARAADLRRHTPKSIRRALLGADADGGVTVVDAQWRDRAIDVEVGDVILVDSLQGTHGECVAPVPGKPGAVRAVLAGRGSLDVASASVTVRVSRKEYRGLSEYRHLEDPDDETR